ncbi:MAG: replicative DNA helicase [Proteobacteria bacterium]|nr:replicative DNA helicase [Pseudomonadota bacterium]
MATASDTKLALVDTAQADDKSRSVPFSQDAEQALLGALLLNNTLYYEIEGFLRADHFYVGVHGRIFEAMSKLVERDQVADPVSLTDFFGSSDWFKEVGGRTFLEQLNENASTIINIKTYAGIIYNHFLSRQVIDIGSGMVNTAMDVENRRPPAEVIEEAESALFKLAEQGSSKSAYQNLKNPLKGVIERIEAARASGGQVTGVPTGFYGIDSTLGGWQNSDLVILAARPSMGKTAFALNVALNAAKSKMNGEKGAVGVGFFSLEMSAEQLASRLLSSESGISSQDISRGDIHGENFQHLVMATDTLSQLDLYIDDTPALGIGAMRSRARRMKRNHNVGLIIVDYLQLMKGSAKNDANRVQEISEISQGLKSIARELNVPVIALSQLSRAVESRENKRPMLSDLRESGSIEQDADVVMFLYREIYYKEKALGAAPTPEQTAELDSIRNLAELLISKNRKGPTTAIQLVFDGPTTTFKNYLQTE